MNVALRPQHNIDYDAIQASLSESGCALTGPLLSPDECAALTALYPDTGSFRSHVVMERYRFGKGDYKYFRHPLPHTIQHLREATYPHLAEIANDWNSTLKQHAPAFPKTLDVFLEKCHRAGQQQPTPLMLHYEQGGYNCLHQDIYGEIAFPLQLVVMLG